MEQFSLEKYLQDPTRKVVTRNKKDVRIICTDRDSKFPVVFLTKKDDCETETIFAADENGCCNYPLMDNSYDLFFTPQKQSRWVFLYRDKSSPLCYNCLQQSALHRSKESAEDACKELNGFALTEITWEE